MFHRVFPVLVTFGLAVSLLTTSCGAERDPRPSVVLVVLDTLRPDWLGFYGYERETAPFLAGLAEEGALVRRIHSSSSWTAPATASLFTGQYPDRHGVTQGFIAQMRWTEERVMKHVDLMAIGSGSTTLPEVFQQAGYRTVGLATNINIGSEIGFDRGFDLLERHDDWAAGKVFSHLARWKEDLEASEPFFLYLHLNDVHKPYDVRKRWFEPAEDVWIPTFLSASEAEDTVDQASRYQSEIGYLDHWLSRIFSELLPQENLIVCVVSDHGEEFMDHGTIGHHFSLYAEVNRIMLLLHGPERGIRSTLVDGDLSIVDVAPTLLDLAGLDGPTEVDGLSFAPLVSRDAPTAAVEALRARLKQRPVFAHRWANELDLWSVVYEGWKLIDAPIGRELFDLDADPKERANVIAEHPEKAAALRALVEGYRARDYAPDSRRTRVPIGADLLEKLEALGYVEGE